MQRPSELGRGALANGTRALSLLGFSWGLRDTRSTIRSPNKRLRIGVFLVRRSPMNILICSPRAPGLIVTEKWANSQPYELKREGAIGI
jgi:hypothetical protein